MANVVEFFLSAPSRVVQLELIEIYHPSFSKRYRLVRNNRLGVTVTLETDETAFFEYYPLAITRTNTDNTLDQVYKITLGDLGQIMPMELDRVRRANTFLTRPTILYRSYRSDDLSAPMVGPIRLEIVDLPINREGVAFEAKAPTVNRNKTGEFYDLIRFPGLRGCL